VPYALAAKLAFPDRPVIALTGDGAVQMSGINELITIAKYRHRWSDQRLVIFVANNRDLNQVTWEMRIQSGVPKYPGSQDLPDFPYAEYARMLGLAGVRVEKAEDLAAAWRDVLGADRPAVIEVLTDANIPMLPPHVTKAHVKSFTSAMLHDDPDKAPVLVQSVKGVLAGLFPAKNADE
jgi:pyruvate dehydrogenase (quinone)